jgi:competence ComEA-like helix-hairpin-helix protein
MVTHRSEVRAIGATVCFLALVSLAGSAPDAEVEGAGSQLRQKHARVDEDQARLAAPDGAVGALVRGRKMDVNTASARDLELLPGIGPALASRIVAFREKHGAFASVEDLAWVRGIGPKTLGRARPMLKAEPGSSP